MAKNVVIAYLLWLFLGLFGVHHFYLGRDWHAFTWWSTFGGCFGLGWVRDAFKIPEYVNDANESPDYIEKRKRFYDDRKTPKLKIARIFGGIFTGTLFGYLVRLAVPEELVTGPLAEERGWFSIWTFLLYATPCGVGIGVYIVGNIGREKVTSLQSTVIAAYFMLPFFYNDMSSNIISMAISSSISVHWGGREWKEMPYKKRPFVKRVVVLGFCGLIYMSLWGSLLYNNIHLTSQDGEKVKLRDAINNFFTSPAWAQTKQTLSEMYEYYKIHGFQGIWMEIAKALDPEGEANAYKVLGVDQSASQQEITSVYRKLARKWHPDKQKDPTKKEEAAQKFMEIQQAYELLSKIKTRRGHRAYKSRETSDTHKKF